MISVSHSIKYYNIMYIVPISYFSLKSLKYSFSDEVLFSTLINRQIKLFTLSSVNFLESLYETYLYIDYRSLNIY